MQEVPEVTSVGPVGLGPAFGTAEGPGVGRFGQVGAGAGPPDLLDHEAPSGGGLQGEGHVGEVFEPLEPRSQIVPGGRADLARANLTRLRVQVVVRLRLPRGALDRQEGGRR